LRNSIAEFDFAVKKYVGSLRGFMEFADSSIYGFLDEFWKAQPKVAGMRAVFCVQWAQGTWQSYWC
ncbi:MAG: hypothetical protein LUG61_05065, partial [Lachnospiraceae bacterium]|nr:hypothetical protein [Lachnospiraceae bacterium]